MVFYKIFLYISYDFKYFSFFIYFLLHILKSYTYYEPCEMNELIRVYTPYNGSVHLYGSINISITFPDWYSLVDIQIYYSGNLFSVLHYSRETSTKQKQDSRIYYYINSYGNMKMNKNKVSFILRSSRGDYYQCSSQNFRIVDCDYRNECLKYFAHKTNIILPSIIYVPLSDIGLFHLNNKFNYKKYNVLDIIFCTYFSCYLSDIYNKSIIVNNRNTLIEFDIFQNILNIICINYISSHTFLIVIIKQDDKLKMDMIKFIRKDNDDVFKLTLYSNSGKINTTVKIFYNTVCEIMIYTNGKLVSYFFEMSKYIFSKKITDYFIFCFSCFAYNHEIYYKQYLCRIHRLIDPNNFTSPLPIYKHNITKNNTLNIKILVIPNTTEEMKKTQYSQNYIIVLNTVLFILLLNGSLFILWAILKKFKYRYKI